MPIAAVVGAIGAGIAGATALGTSLYNWWQQKKQNQADRDYQEATQQEVWNREDTAVQRRRADLEAAGLNPNLAAGSAASAGAVVGRNNTQASRLDDVGKALDAALSVQAYQQGQLQTQAMKKQLGILDSQSEIAAQQALQASYDSSLMRNELNYQRAQKAFDLGMPIYNVNGEFSMNPESEGQMPLDYFNSPFYARMQDALTTSKNSAFMLQRDANMYKLNQWLNVGKDVTGMVGDIGGLYFKGLGAYNQGKKQSTYDDYMRWSMRPQNTYTEFGKGYRRTTTYR